MDEDEEAAFLENAEPTQTFSTLQTYLSHSVARVRAILGPGYPNATCVGLTILLFLIMVSLMFSRWLERPATPILLLISLDGFRPDYLDRISDGNLIAKNLRDFWKDGVRAEWMSPVFPSVTFTNHWSLITGVYPSSHGVVNNVYHAPEYNITFNYQNISLDRDGRFWMGNPFWAAYERSGKKAATAMWPGSEAPSGTDKVYPTYSIPYSNMPSATKIEKVLEWINMKQGDRPGFITLYLNEADNTGHAHGPNDVSMGTTIAALDDALGDLFQGIEKSNVAVNIIIVSDHGMAETSSVREVALDEHLNLDEVVLYSYHPLALIEPKDASKIPDIYEKLKVASDASNGTWSVWLRSDMVGYNFTHPHVSSIIALPHDGWVFVIKGEGRGKWIAGTHGFDPDNSDMRATFLARGPNFQRGKRLPGGWRNVELWQLFARLTGLSYVQTSTNGTKDGMRMFESVLVGV
jgi:predicted AlkP superfamily pyrophosphatase or phosphodiesterase